MAWGVGELLHIQLNIFRAIVAKEADIAHGVENYFYAAGEIVRIVRAAMMDANSYNHAWSFLRDLLDFLGAAGGSGGNKNGLLPSFSQVHVDLRMPVLALNFVW